MILLHKYGFVKNLVQTLPLGLVITDSKGRVLFFNAYMQKNLHVFADEFLNEDLGSFLDKGSSGRRVFHSRGQSYPVQVQNSSYGHYRIFFIRKEAVLA